MKASSGNAREAGPAPAGKIGHDNVDAEVELGLVEQPPPARTPSPVPERGHEPRSQHRTGDGMSDGRARRGVQLAVDDLRHHGVGELHEIVVGGRPIERRDSRHILHCTSSACSGRAVERRRNRSISSCRTEEAQFLPRRLACRLQAPATQRGLCHVGVEPSRCDPRHGARLRATRGFRHLQDPHQRPRMTVSCRWPRSLTRISKRRSTS